MATAEELATAFVSDGHKYGWRFAKVWGEQNPKGNPVAHTMLFSQLKFKAEIEGKEYVLGGQAVYETNSSQISSILPVGNQARAGSQQLLFVLFYDPDAPDSPAYTNAGRVSPSSNVITLQEHQFLVRLTVSTQSATRAEYTTVVDQSIAHIFCTDRSGSNLGNNKYSKWWIDGGTLDDDGWDFCFEFSQDTPANIKSFSVCLETNYPLPPTEEARISEANGLYLYMDDHAELQVGGGCADSSLPHYLDPASIKTIDLAADLPQLELRYKDTDGTVYELKGGAKVDTSNLVTLDTAQTVEGAKTFSEPVTLEAEGTADSHAVTKSYVDSKIEAVASSSEQGLAGVAKLAATQTFTGANTFSGTTNFTAAVTAKDPVNATELATKQYVDAKATEAAGDQANLVTLNGAQTITGAKTFGVAPSISVPPSEDFHAATKAYVDSQVQAMANGGPVPEPAASSILFSGTLSLRSQRYSGDKTGAQFVGPQHLNQLKLFTADGRRLDFIKVPTVPGNTAITDGDTSAWEGLQVIAKLVAADAADTVCQRVAMEDISTHELQADELKGTISYLPTLAPDANIASFWLSFGPSTSSTGQNIGSWDAQGKYMGLGLAVTMNANLSNMTDKPVPLVRLDFEQAPKLARAEFSFSAFRTLLVDYSFDGVAYKTLQSGLNGDSSFDFEPAENGHDLAQKVPQVAQFDTAPIIVSDAGTGLQAVNRSYVHRNFMPAPKSFLAVKDYGLTIRFPAYSTNKITLGTADSGSKTYGFTFSFTLSKLKLETAAGPLFVRKYAIVSTTYKSNIPGAILLLTPAPCEPTSAATTNIATDMKDYEFLCLADVFCTPQAYSDKAAKCSIQPGAFFNSATDGGMTVTTCLGQEVVGAHSSSVVNGKSGTSSITFKPCRGGGVGLPSSFPNAGLLPLITHVSCSFDLAKNRVISYFQVQAHGHVVYTTGYISFKAPDGTFKDDYDCTDPAYFGPNVDAFIPDDVIRFDPGEDEESDTTYKTVTYNPYVSREEFDALAARLTALEGSA